MKSKIFYLKLILLFAFSLIQAQSLTKFSGLVYFDYFYNISNKDINKTDLQGFQFRRVFFTADFDVTNKLSARFRIEPEYQGIQNNNKQFVFLKDMYFLYKLNNSQFLAGLMPTPNFEIEERYWGYRSIERTQSDLRGWITVRDIGLLYRGKFFNDNFSYAVMLANNSFHGTETDKYKKIYFHLSNQVTKNFALSFDFNFANGNQNKNIYYTRIGFYGNVSSFTGGITLVNQLRQKALSNNANQFEYGLSTFGNVQLNDEFKYFVRFDLFEPNDKNGKDKEYTFFTGLDYRLEKNLNIIPNIIYNYYENRNFKDDLTFKVTFYYQF
ncbi:MAG: hypothetical protein N3F03_02905 [Ignavibacteria bacterium]|nr:hypothetical protein [Ignavibacteria bacterium]